MRWLKHRAFPVLVMLTVTAFSTSLGVFMVAERHQAIRKGYLLTELAKEVRKLSEENRKLRLERSVLTSPERIEKLAKLRGMVPPSPQQVVSAEEANRD